MCIGDLWALGLKTFYSFSKQGLLGSMGGRTFGNVGKVQKKNLLRQ